MPTPSRHGGLLADRLRVQPDPRRATRLAVRGAKPAGGPSHPGPGRRPLADQARAFTSSRRTAPTTRSSATCREGNGEPHLCLFPEARHAEPPRAGAGVRAARQLLRRWRGQRRWPRVDDGGLRHRLRRAHLAALLPGQPPRSLSVGGELSPSPGPAAGYLWDRAAEKGVSYRSYGEFIKNGKTPDDPGTTSVKALQGHFDPLFRSFDLDYPDVKRGRAVPRTNWPGSRRPARCRG